MRIGPSRLHKAGRPRFYGSHETSTGMPSFVRCFRRPVRHLTNDGWLAL
ncbi:hypothetical protein NSERUTF1_1943 [Nocardia seriolae]|nr:hypothetical protein NSERUTF1_1943 [Nocardia seriolae]